MLVLHIGTHKTGTSALQAVFLRAAPKLLEHGVRYLEAGRDGRLAHHRLAWSIRGRRQTDMSVWDGVRRELAASRSAVNVLSTEGFWFEDPARIRAELGDQKHIRIVLYLRRQDKYLQSLYKQSVTSGRKTDFQTWLEDKTQQRGNYLSVVDAWASAFGGDAIVVRPYERGGRAVNVVEDFSQVIGLDFEGVLKGTKSGAYNPSPRRELLQLLRAFNQLDLDVNQDKLFYALMGGNKAYARSIDLLSFEESRSLMARFEESNQLLIEKYYRDAQTPLFPEMIPSEPPAIWAPGQPEYFQMTVDMLTAVVEAVTSGEGNNRPRARQKRRPGEID